jgi:NADP-dependent 3-hydroxy acid dehydrogenase YdfG
VSLDGRVAVITGASAGIGAACARAFAARGIAVALAARRADRLAAVVRELTVAGGRALAVPSDVTSEAEMRSLVTRTLTVFGRLDILVCNAGVGFLGSPEESTAEVTSRLMAVNYLGTVHAIRAALPHFEAQGHGHLLIVSSIVARRPIPGYEAYAASKAAQAAFGEALRARLGGGRIHVSLVYPVSTETEFREAMRRDYGQVTEGIGPQQRPEEVAAAMLRCLDRPRAEVFPYRPSRALALLTAVAPATADRLARRYGRTRIEA